MLADSKMNKKLEGILAGLGILAGISLLAWSGFNTLKTRVELEREARERGVSVYEVCKERGRSDVVDMVQLEEGAKNIGYVQADLPVPVYTNNTTPIK